MAVQKSFTMTAMLCVCLLHTTATLPVLERVDEGWVKEALDVVLAEASVSHCSLIFITDRTSSYSYEALRIRVPANKTGGDVVLDVADDGSVGVNLTMTQVVAQARKMRLMSWCTLVVVFSDSPTFLSVFAEMADKGRLMVWETRLLVITRLPLSNLQDLLQNYWTFSMMNTMFLKLNISSGRSHCQIYGHMPYGPTGSHVAQLANLKFGNVLVYLSDRALFPEKYNNFHGMKINLTWIPLTPYWMPMKRPGPNGTEVTTFSGREYSIMESMALILNFSMNALPYTGWDPVMKLLRSREAFFWPVNLPILPHMLELYDFSFFLERSTLAFAMIKPSVKPSWESLYRPLRIEVWGLVVATLVIVYIVLLMMNASGKDKGPGAWLVMKQVLGTLLDEAIPGELPQRSNTRVVLTAWLIFSFVVGTVYRSNLTAYLTIPKYPPRIETLGGLVDANVKQVHRAFFHSIWHPVYQYRTYIQLFFAEDNALVFEGELEETSFKECGRKYETEAE
ncbi:uncharacterized protein LOC135116113 [Scylla paramamosain]|uniref:uncharacterized protein LOC135116113 n=1 Tax=Scylla paramamosain TaxID=85552 RepID=UPI0030826DCA